MSPSLIQLLLVVVIVLVLFGGRGKISSLMGDMAKGITSFRKGLKDEDESKNSASQSISDRGETVDVTPEKKPESSGAES